ncbi:alpha/beta hydrolase [Paenibacillus thalictri]|uniref:Alpha/beta hydrolase n=1 Tax=Paenibacillus thalictri TaxID=2527873 RepID=A0A4Q9DGD0_9BACL|nr:alpha/beta hydrolase [Paenibacillus thalictri]TBL71347.1 alpha/beta hydrolase [Paenibacillus thalictri]
MEKVLLWAEQTPFAQGDTDEDIPYLVPFPVEHRQAPAVIVCPGGGYGRKAPHEGEPIARWLNSIGIAAFVLQYRVAPYRHPVPLGDAKRAIRLVRGQAEQWGIDPQRLGILGFSAGGHLASSTGLHYDEGDREAADPLERISSRPDLMILCYPVISLTRHFHEGSKINLLGPEPDEQLALLLSGELQVNGATPPTFLWHTADDAAVPVENSLLLAMALSEHRIPHELHVYESGRHGLGLADEHPEAHTWTQLCEKWLRRRGF